jgi:hypothetical protein
MEPFTIRYIFTFPDSSKEKHELKINRKTLILEEYAPDYLPEWTRLEFHQCRNCPLSPEDYPRCPAATNLVRLLSNSHKKISFDTIGLEVTTPDRTITCDISSQRALSSLIGLILATCGCPHTGFLKPMARFHLPLANPEETTYRAASMYLLAQYFRKKKNMETDLMLDGLKEIYNNLHMINVSIADQIRDVHEGDSPVNALIILDYFAHTIPQAIAG